MTFEIVRGSGLENYVVSLPSQKAIILGSGRTLFLKVSLYFQMWRLAKSGLAFPPTFYKKNEIQIRIFFQS